jgi:hypothetical protein
MPSQRSTLNRSTPTYRADGHGAAAHDAQMMVTRFAYAYAVALLCRQQ